MLKKHKQQLLGLSVGITTHFDNCQKAYQQVICKFCNQYGNSLKHILGESIFLPRKAVSEEISRLKYDSKEHLQFQFTETSQNGILAGFVNVKKTLEWLLEKPAMQYLINPEYNVISGYLYVDAYPWMKWSRFAKGQTAARFRIVDETNSSDTWLGPDNYELISTLGKYIFKQLKELSEIDVKGHGKGKVLVRHLGDGNQRRTAGSSSHYPIPESPEHRSQLGDMTIYCEKPVWT